MFMRPVERGFAPGTYLDYREAQSDLIERIGDYCSYCERQIETHLAVEHIQPKSRTPDLGNEWTNFLLACVNCNSCKGAQAIVLEQYFWPDTDNTFLAFDYLEGGIVTPHPKLDAADAIKSQSTITLFGLDVDPGNPDRNKHPTQKDKRWQRRQQIWELAHKELDRLHNTNTEDIRQLIVEVAIGRGLFSIWMKVFEQDHDMRCRFISRFQGTASDCFSTLGVAINRLGGSL
jgi:uncharacterized protein (TIGR02646 family)